MSGNYCVTAAGQTKARVGVQSIFEMNVPKPCDASPVGEIVIEGESYALSFSYEIPVKITELKDGRRRLTLSSPPTHRLAGRQGAAFVVTDSTCWPCDVLSYDIESQSTVAILAEPLPSELPSGDAFLYFCYTSSTLPICEKDERDCLMTVSFTPVEVSGPDEQTLKFLVDFVHQIFSTGVTETDLRRYYYTLSSQPSQDAGYSPALQAGEDELILELRDQLASKNLTEDDIPAASSLRQAHLDFAAASMFRLSSPDKADELHKKAKKAVLITLKRLLLDSDKDGTPESSTPMASRACDFSFVVQQRRGRKCRR